MFLGRDMGSQPGVSQPAKYLRVGEAQANMPLLHAQFLAAMRHEIDDEQSAARRQNPGTFRNRCNGIKKNKPFIRWRSELSEPFQENSRALYFFKHEHQPLWALVRRC